MRRYIAATRDHQQPRKAAFSSVTFPTDRERRTAKTSHQTPDSRRLLIASDHTNNNDIMRPCVPARKRHAEIRSLPPASAWPPPAPTILHPLRIATPPPAPPPPPRPHCGPPIALNDQWETTNGPNGRPSRSVQRTASFKPSAPPILLRASPAAGRRPRLAHPFVAMSSRRRGYKCPPTDLIRVPARSRVPYEHPHFVLQPCSKLVTRGRLVRIRGIRIVAAV